MIALSEVRALQQKKYRDRDGLFLVQGPKLVGELLRSSFSVIAVFGTSEAIDALGDAKVPLQVLAAHQVEKLGTQKSGNVLVAVVEQPNTTPVRALGADELIFALNGVADPGNMGTLLRIADWFGVNRILCSLECVEVFNPKCVQASMGSLFRVPVETCVLEERIPHLQRGGAVLYRADMDGTPVHRTSLQRPAILVLGSESHGISAAINALPGITIAVPRAGKAESLNVAMAASALGMEFLRQHQAG